MKGLVTLNPGAVLPTAKALSSSVLDSSYVELKMVFVYRVKMRIARCLNGCQ
ncbi:hypothetical protein PC116_g17981 [Phytophthora cactorum]|nr:hypothetical protein PC116_g17981 [Phytophthora cactorum]